jgi:ATP-dependent DNA helicase RecG
MTPINLELPIEKYPKLQPKLAPVLRHLGVKKIKDLLFHLPFRYDNFTQTTKIYDVLPDATYTVQGQIISVKNIFARFKRMTITEAVIEDETGRIKAVWYNQPFLARTLREGAWGNFSGKTKYGKNGIFLSNPAQEIIVGTSGFKKDEAIHTGRLVPVYPETSGISSRWIRFLIHPLIPLIKTVKETLPKELIKRQKLFDIKTALEEIHFPKTLETAKIAKRRLAFDEVFALHLLNLTAKQKLEKQTAPKIKFNEKLIKEFVASLPFKLTNAQRRSAWEIIQDMEKISPMNRLLEGDVGSGKTLVAALAALNASSQKFQAVFMAPTEILAIQHFNTLSKLLSGKEMTIGLLTSAFSEIYYCAAGKKNKLSKKGIKTLIKDGDVDIIVGTHAVIQKDVEFKNLALIVVDEQHRFGVEQRAQLSKKHTQHSPDGLHQFAVPHFLSMTATPIPRTLALTVYGDLDISLLNEMPAGRQKIITRIIPAKERSAAYQFIRKEIESGRQAFVICPRIEISKPEEGKVKKFSQRNFSLAEIKAVKEEYKKLSEKIFPDIEIGMLHGKMKAVEKEKVMREFSENKTKILVSTSVVEVGVDIPNATIMMVEGAERFGLAQLHQFRGRVGRGKYQSYCFLFPESFMTENNQRLKAMVVSQNGFELAQKDLEIRGPGDFWGGRQSGFPDLIMDSLGDTELIKNSREEAQKLIEEDPELTKHPLLKEKLRAFTEQIHLE